MHPPVSQNVTFTYTDNLEQTSAFFRDVMELELVVDQGACHIYRFNEASFIGVCCLPDRPVEKTAVTITLVSDEVDAWYAFLSDKGVAFVKTPSYSAEFGVYSALFISPHGYRIEIQRFDDPDWSSNHVADADTN